MTATTQLRSRKEWQFFAALPRADGPLAVACLLLTVGAGILLASAAGLAVGAGAVAAAPIIIGVGLVAAAGVGLYHLGGWLGGKLFD